MHVHTPLSASAMHLHWAAATTNMGTAIAKAEADASQQQRQAAQRAEAVPPVSYAEVAAADERFACPGCSTLTALRVSRGFSDEGNGLAGVLAVPLFIVACLIFVFTICSMLRVLRQEFQPKRRLRKPRNDVELGEIVFDGRGCTKLHGEGPMPRESPWEAGGQRSMNTVAMKKWPWHPAVNVASYKTMGCIPIRTVRQRARAPFTAS